eukprot:TRINITY_DN13198_c0_g1_i2.p1 TRINITY_DN13198_c0_g1~~TRINITY_DN13198_c0_g1_i2.p1  ORF type:complete len:246 (+),score=63.42 TRINITY_DN13198_c0_g1_i2:511-1248(+)
MDAVFGLRWVYKQLAGSHEVSADDYQVLLDGLATAKDFTGAMAIAQLHREHCGELSERQLNVLVQAAGDVEQALGVFDQLIELGCTPEPLSVARVIRLCEADTDLAERKLGEWAERWPHILQSYGVWEQLAQCHQQAQCSLKDALSCYLRWRGSGAKMSECGVFLVLAAIERDTLLGNQDPQLLALARAAHEQCDSRRVRRLLVSVLDSFGLYREAAELDTALESLPMEIGGRGRKYLRRPNLST